MRKGKPMKLQPLPSAVSFRDDRKRSLSGETESVTARIADSPSEREAKRLADMQAALKRLRELPSARESAAAQRLNKAQQLLQQIRALKQAIALATPEHAAALAAQLRQLAGQLASLGKGGNSGLSLPNAGSSSGGDSPPADAATVGTAESASVETAITETSAVVEANTPAAGAANVAGQTNPAAVDEAPPALAKANDSPRAATTARPDDNAREDGRSSDESTIEEALRSVLKEAWAELKSAVALLKAKMQRLPPADHVRVEAHLRAIDTLASQAGIGTTYALSFSEPSAPRFIDVKA